jgi:RNA-binding protein YhbY
VGHGAVTDAVAAEARALLKTRGLVKVKLDRAAAVDRGRKEMAEDLASRAEAGLVEVRRDRRGTPAGSRRRSRCTAPCPDIPF